MCDVRLQHRSKTSFGTCGVPLNKEVIYIFPRRKLKHFFKANASLWLFNEIIQYKYVPLIYYYYW